MDLNKIAPLIQKDVQDALKERRYSFGFQGRMGLTNKIASGNLFNSVKVEVKEKDNINTLSIDMLGYWQFVEEGRLPGRKGVPVEAIKIWMEEKGIGIRNERGRFVKGHRARKKSYKTGKDDVYPIAFAIQKSIQKFGIRSAGFLEVALGKISEDKKINELLEGDVMSDLIKIITTQ
jgi:hypothetical protein